MDAAIADDGGFNEEIRHVLRLNGNVNDSGARGEVEEPPVEQNALADLIGEKDAGVVFGDVDEEMRGVTEFVGPFVGDEFEVVEAIDAAIEFRAIDPEDGVALDFFFGGVAGDEGDAILAFARERVT